jgi:hypothetical protein
MRSNQPSPWGSGNHFNLVGTVCTESEPARAIAECTHRADDYFFHAVTG